MASQKSNIDYDVVIVGAGISGINFAYRLQERCPNLSYIVLENRHEIGGTWSLFQYPGIRSDSDLFTFGFPWRPWNHDCSIAKGDMIIDYVKESASMYGIDKKILFHHQVDSASWSSPNKQWTFNVTANGKEKKTLRSNFFMMCTGYYDYHTPLKAPIPGLDNFKGQVIHPQFWPKDLDYKDKEVVIIGSGATAVTVVPAMSKEAKHVTMLQRSPSYVLSQPAEDGIEKFIRRYLPWWQHTLIRWKWITIPFFLVTFCQWFPNAGRKLFKSATEPQLPKEYGWDPTFNPSYNPFEQRVCFCPDADFYRALRKGKTSVVTGVIDNITTDTIKLEGGKELHPDIIVTATGLKLQVGGGINIDVDGKDFTVADKYVWKGVMIQDLPNCAFVIGYVDASWTLGADATAQLTCRMLNRMSKEKVTEVVPRMSESERKNLKDKPLLYLTSTYIQKGGNQLPKTKEKGQWQPRSYFWKDILMAWFGDIKTGTEWIRGV